MTQPTSTGTAVGPTIGQRWRSVRWIVLTIAVIIGIAAVTVLLTAPRPGGPMDPTSTSRNGARALVTLLGERGVEVVEAPDISTVEREARPGTLLAVLPTFRLLDDTVLTRLSTVPGDRLLVGPSSRTREELAPRITLADSIPFGDAEPDCDLREATRAGTVSFGVSQAYAAADDWPITSCYDGALVRYEDDGRVVTVVGSGDFMTNGALLDAGNAALAMNLAGTHSRVIWYAPQQREGSSDAGKDPVELIPEAVRWLVFQLCIAVVLLALWRGRRLGPLVAERMPVVVRASETVEGLGRLYRSRRARDRAADALRTAALQRLLPRLALDASAPQAAVGEAVAQRCGLAPQAVMHTLFGPPPDSDDDLVNLAHELDNIERQVAQS